MAEVPLPERRQTAEAADRLTGRTSAEVREAIRSSPDSIRALAARYRINPKTVAKWKKRDTPDDLRSGPKARTVKLSEEEEDIIVRFREHTLLPLDDCLYALQAQIPHLSRSSLHRCLRRHGLSRLAELGEVEQQAPATLGQLHIDMSEVRSGDGVHYLFNAIDQASKFVCVRMATGGGGADAAAFLEALAARLPFRISQVVTLDAAPFVTAENEGAFAKACQRLGIDHRQSGDPHPWTRSRDIRMERMLTKIPTFAGAADLAGLLQNFVHAYNFRRRLKTLGGRTPYEFICRAAARQPALFLRQPHHEMVGLEIMS